MNILITGMTGFIGGHLCQRLLDDQQHQLVGLVRPETAKARYERFLPAIQIVEADLTDETALHRIFEIYRIDGVLHLAALRGSQRAAKAAYEQANITAPVCLANAALRYHAKFIFCSSVGVFGTIPIHFPPTEATPKIGDNAYHATKIEAERRLSDLQRQGLQLVIIRPIITYGIGDTGFPVLLIKLIDRGVLLPPTRDIQIHLVDVRTLVEAFVKAAETPAAVGKIYTITDHSPISLHALVNHIALTLRGKTYPRWKRFPTSWYYLAEGFLSHILRSEAWMARMKLMSHHWYYDSALAEQELGLPRRETIPNIDYVIDWYKQLRHEGTKTRRYFYKTAKTQRRKD